MKKITREGLIGKLEERGFKITPQRLAIVDALVEQGHLHPGARLVYEGGKEEKKEFELIDRLCDAQRAFSTWHHQKRFSLIRWKTATKRICEEHINLICERCKKILDYKVPIAIDQRGVAEENRLLDH